MKLITSYMVSIALMLYTSVVALLLWEWFVVDTTPVEYVPPLITVFGVVLLINLVGSHAYLLAILDEDMFKEDYEWCGVISAIFHRTLVLGTGYVFTFFI